MNETVALVTGANKGIGYEIARQLGEKGITVLVGARDPIRGNEAVGKLKAEGISAQFISLDVTCQKAIDEAASYIGDKFGKLDILVNNAGVFMEEKVPSALDIETLTTVFETNVFGVFRTTKAMIPLLLKSDKARIVNISSSLGSLTLHSDPDFELGSFLVLGYNTSKTAVNALTLFFAKELKNTTIKVNSADPGYCATEMNGFSGHKTPQQGAQTPMRLATLPEDGPTGGFFDDNGVVPW
jgi:NAD(P)-dependent dehydrogenase (short-subunit alcohol dehydrogenase family)